MDFGDYLLFIVGAILVNNILLAKFLGHCPFIGVSKKMDTATGMSMAVIFVITVAGAVTWLVQQLHPGAQLRLNTCRPSPSSWLSPLWCSWSRS
jgi:Na+-translocating ferredoxin:NAD+ oxidoreductase RnfA subunit